MPWAHIPGLLEAGVALRWPFMRTDVGTHRNVCSWALILLCPIWLQPLRTTSSESKQKTHRRARDWPPNYRAWGCYCYIPWMAQQTLLKPSRGSLLVPFKDSWSYNCFIEHILLSKGHLDLMLSSKVQPFTDPLLGLLRDLFLCPTPSFSTLSSSLPEQARIL